MLQGKSPAPAPQHKAAEPRVAESDEDDGSRDAFSMPPAQPDLGLAAGQQQRQQAQAKQQDRKQSLSPMLKRAASKPAVSPFMKQTGRKRSASPRTRQAPTICPAITAVHDTQHNTGYLHECFTAHHLPCAGTGAHPQRFLPFTDACLAYLQMARALLVLRDPGSPRVACSRSPPQVGIDSVSCSAIASGLLCTALLTTDGIHMHARSTLTCLRRAQATRGRGRLSPNTSTLKRWQGQCSDPALGAQGSRSSRRGARHPATQSRCHIRQELVLSKLQGPVADCGCESSCVAAQPCECDEAHIH